VILPKIAAPIADPAAAEELIRAGASEFFCGIGSERYRYLSARNYAAANLKDFDALKALTAAAAPHGVPVYLCVNSYINCRDVQGEVLERAAACGVAGFILADAALIPGVKAACPGARIVLSTLAVCMNSQGLEFYAGQGVRRVVLERQHTLAEALALGRTAARLGLELELFVKNLTCTNINGTCLFHGLVGDRAVFERGAGGGAAPCANPKNNAPCRRDHSITFFRRDGGGGISSMDSGESPENRPEFLYCGACMLYLLAEAAPAAVKIVGRNFPPKRILRDVAFVRKYLDLLAAGALNGANYTAEGRRLHREFYGRDCSAEECYYFEPRKARD
jgi:hypothetical protein